MTETRPPERRVDTALLERSRTVERAEELFAEDPEVPG